MVLRPSSLSCCDKDEQDDMVVIESQAVVMVETVALVGVASRNRSFASGEVICSFDKEVTVFPIGGRLSCSSS